MSFIVSIDQSTSGTKAALYDDHLNRLKVLRKDHAQYYPAPGYVEHDAQEIWENTASLLCEITSGLNKKEIAGIGIANQRETTVIWDRATGMPVAHAVVWQDVRAGYLTDRLKDASNEIFSHTGLIPSPYYSAANVRLCWMPSRSWQKGQKTGNSVLEP